MTQMKGVGKQGIIIPRTIGTEAMQSLVIEPTGYGASQGLFYFIGLEGLTLRRESKMDFKEFTESIAALLNQKMGDACTATVTEVPRNNGVRRTGIVIIEEANGISPIIYLGEPYRQYQGGMPLQEAAGEIMGLYEKHAHGINIDMGFFRDFSLVGDKVFYKVINYEKNKGLLKDVPYFRWHDLAVTFYYMMEEAAFGRASVMVHNSHLDMWGKPAGEIYRIAQRNMEQGMPELLAPMQEMLEEMAGINVGQAAGPLYVLTNRERIFGASAMLYSRKIGELAGRLGSDLLVLPSSVHEVLLLPDGGGQEYGFYKNMVREVNTTQVDPEEILSFNLYRYNREKGGIEEIDV